MPAVGRSMRMCCSPPTRCCFLIEDRFMMGHRCPALLTRRDLLRGAGAGFGLLGLAGTLHASGLLGSAPVNATGVAGPPHFPARAKRVIFLFMNGGPSHVDTFDPKPALKKHEGEKPSGAFE